MRTFRTVDGKTVKKGDLGGWIEKEENLSQGGSCWVADGAGVYGKSEVYGDAKVYGDAEVCGKAEVYGYTQVYGGATVSGKAKVYGDAEIYGKAKVDYDVESGKIDK